MNDIPKSLKLTDIQKLKVGLNYLHQAYDPIYDVAEQNYKVEERVEHDLSNVITSLEIVIREMEDKSNG